MVLARLGQLAASRQSTAQGKTPSMDSKQPHGAVAMTAWPPSSRVRVNVLG
jgi:hypothetical protein